MCAEILSYDTEKELEKCKSFDYKPCNAELKHNGIRENDGNERMAKNHEMCRILEEFSDVFTEDLPSGNPAKRLVVGRIDSDLDAEPPHRSQFLFSRAETIATKKQVTSLHEINEMRPRCSPYRGPLFICEIKSQV